MKLIRLTSNNSNVFSNNFQADLELNENSQIALLNTSFEKKQITYSTNNDVFDYTIGTPDMKTAELDTQTYDKSNFKFLLRDIEKKLNQSLNTANPTQAGLAWDVATNSDNKVTIRTDYGYVIDPFGNSNFDNPGVQTTGNNVYQKDSGASENTPDSYIGSDNLVFYDGLNGAGYFRFTINQLNNVDGGVFIGLSNIKPENMGDDYSFTTAKLAYGIYAKQSGSNYEFIDSNGKSVSTLAPENFGLGGNDNDVLVIRASEGKIEGAVYSDTHPNGTVLFSEEDTGTKNLYPIVGFYSQTNVSIRRLRYTPYDNEDEEFFLDTQDFSMVQAHEGTPQPPQQNSGKHNPMTFKFPNLELAKFLGYTAESITLPVADDVFRLTSNNPILFTDVTEAYIVELMNLKLESFDGFKEERKNVLALINNARESTLDDVLYEAKKSLQDLCQNYLI